MHLMGLGLLTMAVLLPVLDAGEIESWLATLVLSSVLLLFSSKIDAVFHCFGMALSRYPLGFPAAFEEAVEWAGAFLWAACFLSSLCSCVLTFFPYGGRAS